MATLRKEAVDTARHRRKKREATRLGKLSSYSEAQKPPIGLVDEPKEPCTGARQTET